jgi:Flp pilus assembly pilin Flp
MKKNQVKRQRGASLVEYSLLIASISLIAIPAIQRYTVGIKRSFCSVILLKSREQITADGNYTDEGKCMADGSVIDLFAP